MKGGETRPGVGRLVGRSRQLETIAGALAEACAGRGQLVLLSGEPGIGKTRLADEASAVAADHGVPVVWGRCWEAGGAPPFWVWTEALGNLIRQLDGQTLARALGQPPAALVELLPELRTRLPGVRPVPAGGAEESRFALFRAVTALLREAAAAAGLCAVLDDLHAADESSLALLHFVARELRGMRIFVLGTFRDVEARMDARVDAALARVRREGIVLPLDRLVRDEAAALLRGSAGGLAAELEGRILGVAQGNPLWLSEMGRLVQSEGGPELVAAGAVPEGVRDVLRGRLARVSIAAQAVLEAAAVVGDEFDATTVAEVTGNSGAAAADALGEAIRAGVLSPRQDAFRFAHALYREVLYQDLPLARRQALHAAVTQVLAPRAAAGATGLVAELAHHGLCGPPERVEAAVPFVVAAAERSLALAAYDEAVLLLERARTVLGRTGGGERAVAEVLLALGEARIRRGETDAGKALCREVGACAKRLGDGQLLARAALGYGLEFTSALTDPVLVALLEDARAALPATDTPLKVRVAARLAGALQPNPRGAIPIALAREAIDSARRIGDPPTLLGAIHAGMAAMMNYVHPRERMPLNLEAERLAVALHDGTRLMRAHARLFFDLVELHDLPAADARVDALARLAEELRAPHFLYRVPLMRAMRAAMHGRFAEAERLSDEGQRLARAAADPFAKVAAAMQREGLLRVWERHADMEAFDLEMRGHRALLAEARGWQEMHSAFVYTRLERREEAARHAALLPEDSWPLTDSYDALLLTSEICAFVGKPEHCARLLELLLPYADVDVSWGLYGTTWDGPVTRALGLLAEALGRWDDAERWFTDTLGRTNALDAGPCRARTRYEYGRALEHRGRAMDRERARALIAEARAEAESLAMPGLIALADRRLAGMGQAPARTPAAVSVDPGEVRFAQEGEYWAVTFAGTTTRLKDSLGLRYLARLLAEPDREIHALDLSGARGAHDGATDAGDAGELLDPEARASYARRLDDLRETLAEAESFGDEARAARAHQELEFLGAELSRAVGLGGRARRAGGAAERARTAVQRRIRNALDRIRESAPALADYLEPRIRTGNFCVFRPGAARA